MDELSGMWLGSHWRNNDPVRFELVLIQSGKAIVGNMLEKSLLGEASLTGEVIGKEITFVKKYIDRNRSPVNYTGTLSEHGSFMSGRWVFANSKLGFGKLGFGFWEAYRSKDELSAELQSFTLLQASSSI